jgi:DNA-binding NarL/FixJ family response regulator
MAPRSKGPAATSLWKVLLVDDHPVVRESLALRIAQEEDMEVCAAVGTKSEALSAVQQYHPDVAVIDINLPDGHGLDVIKDVYAYTPNVRMLVFSMHDENLYGERALRAGAQGYLMKSEAPDAVIHAIRGVIRGRLAVSDALSQRLINSRTRWRAQSSSTLQILSDRELQVFELIAEGQSTKQMAQHLCISVKTVETHRSRIKEKLGIGSATELIAAAARWMSERASE